MSKMHYLVRGLVLDQGHVLLTKTRNTDYYFLPGGHIEFGENAKGALLREIQEELGLDGVVQRFLGAIEHLWPESQKDNHEINLVFELEIPSLKQTETPTSLEPKLVFEWVAVTEIAHYNIQPGPVASLVSTYAANSKGFWGSTIEN